MNPMNMIFSLYLSIAMILMNDPLGQPCRNWVFFNVSYAVGLSFRSQYSESSMVILYSWLRPSELATPSMQKFLIIGLLDSYSVLSKFSLPRIFWSILEKLLCMQHIRNSTADSLSRTTSCHAGFYIIWISVLRISMDFISFVSQSDWNIIDYLTKSAHFILFRMG